MLSLPIANPIKKNCSKHETGNNPVLTENDCFIYFNELRLCKNLKLKHLSMLYVCTHVAFTFFNGCVLSKRNALWVNNEMMHSSWADVFFFSMVWLVYFACQNDSITGIGSSILTSRVPLYDPFFFIAKKRKKKQSRRIFYFFFLSHLAKEYLSIFGSWRKRKKKTKGNKNWSMSRKNTLYRRDWIMGFGQFDYSFQNRRCV